MGRMLVFSPLTEHAPLCPWPHPSRTDDDSDWQTVQLPHDGLIGNAPSLTACPNGCSGESYIPRHVLWYRKAFTIPQEWKGDRCEEPPPSQPNGTACGEQR